MAIALYIGPVFACICGLYTPIFMFMMMALGMVSKKAMEAKFAQQAKLGGHTEETLSALRLIFSFA